MKTLTINFLRMVFPFFFSNTGEVGTLFLPSESSIENETINYDGFSDYEVEIIDFMIENTKDKLSVKLFKSNPKTALKAYVIQIENKKLDCEYYGLVYPTNNPENTVCPVSEFLAILNADEYEIASNYILGHLTETDKKEFLSQRIKKERYQTFLVDIKLKVKNVQLKEEIKQMVAEMTPKEMQGRLLKFVS